MNDGKHDPEIAVRDAVAADVRALHDFLRPFVLAREILPRNEAELETLVAHGFVATRQGQIVGFAAVVIYSAKMAEVQALAVAPEARGSGLGTRLVKKCVERAKEQGVIELMAITATEELFRTVGFDYALPNQKRALFLQTREVEHE